MSWTTPSDLRAQVQTLWDRGALLSVLVTGRTLFPRRLTLKRPSSAEMSERFEEVRQWIRKLGGMRHVRLELRQVRHRVLGTNATPQAAWVETLEDALALIGKGGEAARFRALVEVTERRQPLLLDWLARHPRRVLTLAEVWERLLEVVGWVQDHPAPGVYLRQVDLAGVHTKLIEAHRGVLAELLDLTLPDAAIDASVTGVGQFARRYGFRDKPTRIRFRILDPDQALLPGGGVQDLTLDADAFARLDLAPGRVFITENEVNFLAFPPLAGALVIFGAGYGFEMLRRAEWLARRPIHYWGDIDTHGFAILDQLRGLFARVDSFLMDRDTLFAHETLWGLEERPTSSNLQRLTHEEQELYHDLRSNRIRENLRLEQERIGFGWIATRLQARRWEA